MIHLQLGMFIMFFIGKLPNYLSLITSWNWIRL